MGGRLFPFSTFVMPALERLPAPQGSAAIQSNALAVRAPLIAGLFGTAPICVALIVAGAVTLGDRRAILLVARGVAYLVGTIVTTGTLQVPRNDSVAALDPNGPGSADAPPTYVRQ